MFKKPICVVDVGARAMVVLVAHRKKDASFEVLGLAETAAAGIENGEIVNLGDAVEALSDALRKAETQAGVLSETLYLNFDDPQMQSLEAHGTKILRGEGQIEASDIEEACQNALRHVARFEKSLAYSTDLRFLIDDKDSVENPLGVFGNKLEAILHVLQVSSARCEIWQNLVRRCQRDRGVWVLSQRSTARGILRKEDREKKRIILDLGEDFINIFLFERGRIVKGGLFLTKDCEPRRLPEEITGRFKGWLNEPGEAPPVLCTGDLAKDQNLLGNLRAISPLVFEKAFPTGISRLENPRFASLAGLLQIAEELGKKEALVSSGRGLWSGLKDRALSYLNDYF